VIPGRLRESLQDGKREREREGKRKGKDPNLLINKLQEEKRD